MQSAVLVRYGAIAFVSPTPDLNLSVHDWADIDNAVWLSPFMQDRSRQILAGVEGSLGVTITDRRYARQTAAGQIIVPPRRRTITIGGPALFVDEGRAERVMVASAEWPHEESGEPMRTCAFIDQGGEEYDVKAGCLEPCGEDFEPLQPEALVTPRWRGADSVEKDGGRVYAPEPYRPPTGRQHPILENLDRFVGVEPAPAKLTASRMTKSHADRLANAEAMLKSKDKHARVKAKGQLFAFQQEVQAAAETNAVLKGREETVAQGRLRGEVYEIDKHTGRASRLDGLQTLLASGALTRTEVMAGDKYGEIYQAALPALKVANWESSGGGSTPNPEIERQRRLADYEAKKALTDLESLVQAKIRSNRTITALRLVAGEGRCISHFTKGAGRALTTQALKDALGVLADNWGLS